MTIQKKRLIAFILYGIAVFIAFVVIHRFISRVNEPLVAATTFGALLGGFGFSLKRIQRRSQHGAH